MFKAKFGDANILGIHREIQETLSIRCKLGAHLAASLMINFIEQIQLCLSAGKIILHQLIFIILSRKKYVQTDLNFSHNWPHHSDENTIYIIIQNSINYYTYAAENTDT